MPILCVHGNSDNLETFCNLIPLLPHHFYYVCIDLPCHGKSAHAEKGYILNLLWYATCVKRVIDYFKWPKLIYLGHSFGAHIGFVLSALYPELFVKLISVDGLVHVHVSPPNVATSFREKVFDLLLQIEKKTSSNKAPTYSFEDYLNRMKKARRTEVTETQIRAMAVRNLMKVGPDLYQSSSDQRTKIYSSIHTSYEQMYALASEICCPTLVILGKTSLITRPLDNMNTTPERKIRNVTFNVIEGDHDIHLTRSVEVAKIIKPFLTGEMQSKL